MAGVSDSDLEMNDGDLVAFHFGEVEDDERAAIERALLGDRELLGEYFALKRHCERPADDGPRAAVRERLERDVAAAFAGESGGAGGPIPLAPRRRKSRWTAVVGVAAVAAATAGIWFSSRSDDAVRDGQLIDTARQSALSGNTL